MILGQNYYRPLCSLFPAMFRNQLFWLCFIWRLAYKVKLSPSMLVGCVCLSVCLFPPYHRRSQGFRCGAPLYFYLKKLMKAGKVASAGWQVTLCDLIWHVISRGGVVISITNCYIRLTYGLLTYNREELCSQNVIFRHVLFACCGMLFRSFT